MKTGVDRAEIAGNHVLRGEEVGRDQTVHVLLSQIKDLILWRLKLVNDTIRFTLPTPHFFNRSGYCEQNGL